MSWRPRAAWVPALILVAENVVTFWRHYFGGYGFTWDFVQAYYATNAYSVAAIQNGPVPQWLPFQCMGYPFALNLQSALHYPVTWVVALLGLRFDLRLATVLQCSTIFFGALGMYTLVRRVGVDRAGSLIAASIFHFFGGFYSNAQHPDIVRSFALVPWLFATVTFEPGSTPPRLSRLVFLPPLVYLCATGGYPGNLIATSFVLGAYVAAQLVAALARDRRQAGTLAATGVAIAALLLLGLALAAVHLGPVWLARDQMTRYGANLSYRSLWWEHLPLLLFPSTALPGEPSMSSTFLTVPGVLLVLLLSGREVRRQWPWLAVLGLSLSMVIGPRSPIWRLLGATFEPFRFSRFPSSDYRPLIATALIVMATIAARGLARGELGARSFTVRSALGLVAVATAGRSLYGTWAAAPVTLAVAVAIATLALLASVHSHPGGQSWRVACAGLVALVALDAWRVLPAMRTWHEPEIATLYERRGWASSEAALPDASMFAAFPERRPARQRPGHRHWFSWAGYLEGRYMLGDLTPCLLRHTAAIPEASTIDRFMTREWTALAFPATRVVGGSAAVALGPQALDEALSALDAGDPGMSSTRYGIDEIRYRVSLPAETLMVENEIFSPGWEASLGLAEGPRTIHALAVDDALRGWLLPAGDYSMVARFRLPNRSSFRLVSLGSLGIWLGVFGLATYRWRSQLPVRAGAPDGNHVLGPDQLPSGKTTIDRSS